MSKPSYQKKLKRWRIQYTCREPLCVKYVNGKPKSNRHSIYADKRKDFTPEYVNQKVIEYHSNGSRIHRNVHKVLETIHNPLTFEQLHEEVLDEMCKKDDDNQSTIQYQENAFVEPTRGEKNSMSWIPPFFKKLYEQISPDDVFDWYEELENYMLNNKTTYNKIYKDGKFKQIDCAIKQISKRAVRHKLSPIRDQRVNDLASSIKKNLRTNYRTLVGEKTFDAKLVADMVRFTHEIATTDPKFKMLSDFFKVSFNLITRAGETAGIQKDDIEFGEHGENTLVHLKRQTRFVPKSKKLIENGKKYGIVTSRTKGRRFRAIPVTNSEVDQILRQKVFEFQTKEKGADIFGNEGIWRNKKNKPYTPTDIRNVFENFTKKYGELFSNKFGKEYKGNGLHALRHAGASYWYASTKDLSLTASVMGHKKDSITDDVYIHPLLEQLKTVNAPKMVDFVGGGD